MATKAERRQATQNRFKAMQHPLRAQAFRLIRDEGPISPAKIAKALDAKTSDVAYHVKQLVALDCVEEVGNRPVRGAVEHFYRATEQHLVDTEEWAELAQSEPEMAEFLVDEFIQEILDDFVASRKAGTVGLDNEFHITRTPLVLDEEGLQEALESAEEHRMRMLDIAARCAGRQADQSGGTEIPVSSGVVLFKTPSPGGRGGSAR